MNFSYDLRGEDMHCRHYEGGKCMICNCNTNNCCYIDKMCDFCSAEVCIRCIISNDTYEVCPNCMNREELNDYCRYEKREDMHCKHYEGGRCIICNCNTNSCCGLDYKKDGHDVCETCFK